MSLPDPTAPAQPGSRGPATDDQRPHAWLPDLRAAVADAGRENRVSSPLPKFFNPLFRRQGVFNKHVVRAVQIAMNGLVHLAQRVDALGSAARATEKKVQALQAADDRLQRRLPAELAQVRTETVKQAVAAAEGRLAPALGELMHRVEEAAAADAALRARLDALSGPLEALSSQIAALSARIDAATAKGSDTTVQLDRIAARLDARVDALDALLAPSSADSPDAPPRPQTSVLALLRALSGDHARMRTDLHECQDRLAAVAQVVEHVSQHQQLTSSNLTSTQAAVKMLVSRLPGQAGDAASVPPSQDGQSANDLPDADLTNADAMYVALEARFRGPRSLIRERQERYLPIIEQARRRVEQLPLDEAAAPPASTDPLAVDHGVLDLGCGRGEWLELLREQGIPHLGVDRNPFFLQACRERGLEVIDADLMEFLRSRPDASVAAITGLHIIEHLPAPVFQELTREAMRVLRRGGALILETPNPANILTGSLNFLLDPTHVRPVHPEFARFMVECAGFGPVELHFMSPNPEGMTLTGDDPLSSRFRQLFFGPQDYAVVASKP